MRADPRTTVVVITRNRRDELLHTLDQLAALPEQPPVTVVDNASTDATAQAVRAHHPHITLLTPHRNLGAAGRNLAARLATTPYLAFCDDDSWWEPGSLTAAADLLDTHPRLATVTARILVHPHPHPDTPHRHDERAPREDPIVTELRHSPLPRPPWLPGPALGSFLAAATVLRTGAFRTAGGFSPRLWLGGEEELLAADLAAAGWWLTYADHLTVHHRPSPHRDARLRRRHGIRNTLWCNWLRRSAPTALRRTAHLARTVPRDATSVRAFAEAAAGLPWVLRERRPLPPAVEARLRLLEAPQKTSAARRYVG
ncbi:glycosyltransferase family 2 protein [Streptomyces sp. ISL-11]|uniref:glycosyltransferase family 2 protein n=1 Tax=Streptomyces sp. ISL-11 TaxID=2819174 RepID=UPI001BE9746F|nr:glycosyltransferase [Streptomyces sp. ISL-11]MBT2384539.1 glycosyltransferase [Streptomyces sp. ISL-11]